MVVGDIAQEVQVVIIGGGPGGYVAAIRAAQLGQEVVLIEKEELGGTCLHVGCIPSKALIHAANTATVITKAAELGLFTTAPELDMPKLQAWKHSLVHQLTDGVRTLLRQHGVSVVRGAAFFMSDDRIAVETKRGMEYYRFEQAVIATGSRPLALPGFPFDGEQILSSTDALRLTELPKELLVIGGGYIGLELGTAFAKLGSRVTLVEQSAGLLPGTDPTLVEIVKKKLQSFGVTLLTEAEARAHTIQNGRVHVTVCIGGQEQTVTADKVLVTVGRRPNTAALDLERAGLTVDEKGYLPTDGQGRTANRNIFAIGDITHGPMLAHKASKEGIIAAEAIAGLPSQKDMACLPTVIFTDPEIASAGLTEAEALAQGLDVTSGQFPFAINGRALIKDAGDGVCRVIAERESGVVLGVHLAGPEASTLIGEAALAIEMGATLEDLHLTVHPHPSLSEVLMEAAAVADGVAIHLLNRR
ncbi:dihydrolipoyl dehydrogenase [Tumebacillus algifaecis]|uniref:Dihydrolipoyl dehydrogenase n=1 Tax=Tumebacillus algifaecis TaxID=1214604 RepID=A0A223D5C7_9BACL|nr:dihydrolipoyl dehydrogenase [Tumebacillus algifaecis]ASS76687.1 dihydrolipoyl dehydrogenase [Tumebacillus algifaecis]